jgi:hypothetical protein
MNPDMNPKLPREGRRERFGVRLRSAAIFVLALAAIVLILLMIRAFHLIYVKTGG